MSKIGKRPIPVPADVQVTLGDGSVTVKGPKGTLSRPLDDRVEITVADGEIAVAPKEGTHPSFWGLWRALLDNMVTGVSKGFTKSLEFQGVGYRAAVKGNDLELSLGYSHPITVSAPEGITFSVEKSTITVSGIDRELVGQVAAEIRSKRLPEPYKGAGIRYSDEVIRRKQGKKTAA